MGRTGLFPLLPGGGCLGGLLRSLEPSRAGSAEASAQADVISFTSALSSCEKEHLWQQALSLMDAMQCQRIQPNAVTLSVACHAFERGWQPQKAVSLLGVMSNQQYF